MNKLKVNAFIILIVIISVSLLILPSCTTYNNNNNSWNEYRTKWLGQHKATVLQYYGPPQHNEKMNNGEILYYVVDKNTTGAFLDNVKLQQSTFTYHIFYINKNEIVVNLMKKKNTYDQSRAYF